MHKNNYFHLFVCGLLFICSLIPCVPTEGYAHKQSIAYPSYMWGIDYGKDTTYVVGHNPPDTDTVCSAIAYANLKRQLGINAEARIAATPNAETTYVLNYFGVNTPLLLDNAAGKNIILVDHNSFSQAIDGMRDANVLEVIDHHNLTGDVKTSSPIYYRNVPVGCTSTLVWLEYLEANVPIKKDIAGIMLSAILSDTDNLQSNTATDLDKQAVCDLEKKVGIKNRNKFFLSMEEEFAAYKNMSDRDIFYSDYKTFMINGISYGFATVVALTPEKRQDLEKRLNEWAQKNYANQKTDMLFLKIHDLETYSATLSCYGDGALECAVKAFGVADGNKVPLERNISRKTVVRVLQPQIAQWSIIQKQNKAT